MLKISKNICRICEQTNELSLTNITLPENHELVVKFLACASVSVTIF